MKYFFGFLAIIALIIAVGIMVFKGITGGPKDQPQIDLSSYGNTDAVVRLTVEGPVVADQNHNAYQITVGRNTSKVETFKGYERTLIDSKIYENNQESYETFLLALERASFQRFQEPKQKEGAPKPDPRGVCPKGTRYTYELIDGTDTLLSSWSASCVKGTFRGEPKTVRSLFSKQIPELSRTIRGLNL